MVEWIGCLLAVSHSLSPPCVCSIWVLVGGGGKNFFQKETMTSEKKI